MCGGVTPAPPFTLISFANKSPYLIGSFTSPVVKNFQEFGRKHKTDAHWKSLCVGRQRAGDIYLGLQSCLSHWSWGRGKEKEECTMKSEREIPRAGRVEAQLRRGTSDSPLCCGKHIPSLHYFVRDSGSVEYVARECRKECSEDNTPQSHCSVPT